MGKRKRKPKYYIRPDGLHETIRLINGKRVAFRGKTDAEVERKMIEYQNNEERGRLFVEVLDEWVEEHYKTLSPTTAHGYEASRKAAEARFGDMPVKDITAGDVDAYLRKEAKTYSKKTVKARFTVLNLALTKAVIDGDIRLNPCASVGIPKGLKSKPREFPSDEDIKAVKQGVKLTDGLMPYFILYSGLRLGEVLALTYGDIDYKKKVIHVTKSICTVNNKPVVKLPKTQKSIREVILLNKLANVLPKGKASDPLFPGVDGKYIHGSSQAYRWKKWQAAAGTKVTAHQLRHAFATMLFEAGLDAKDAQEQLGHAQLATTMDIYTHIRQQHKNETAAKLNTAAENF